MQTIALFVAKAAATIGASSGTAAATTAAATTTAATTAAATTATAASAASAAASAAAAGAAAGMGGTAAATAATAATAGSAGLSMGSILTALRVGTTAITALSVAAQSRLQAQAFQAEAFESQLQASQELIQSQERANQIERDYNAFVEQGLAVASASGFDIGSGSVREVRELARQDADRQLAITRNGAQMNASLRRARASYLRGAAQLTREGGVLGAASAAARTAIDVSRLG